MITKPNTWVEEDRGEMVSRIVDGMVSQMTFEKMRQVVWDLCYEDVIWQEWADIWMLAEEYAPELLEEFSTPNNFEISQ